MLNAFMNEDEVPFPLKKKKSITTILQEEKLDVA